MKNHFSYRDLVLDEDFRNWVLKNENAEYWIKWLNNHTQYQTEIEKAKEVILHLRFQKDELTEQDLSTLWERIGASNANQTIRKEKKYYFSWGLKIAASLLVIAVAVVFIKPYFDPGPLQEVGYITKHNPKGQKSTFRLPDGTTVTLNSGSELSYPESFSAKQRNVKLVGEAFFKVKKDKTRPFIVSTGGVRTTVLGTRFNVSAYPNKNQLSVMLAEGKVKISGSLNALAGHSYLLNPGEQLVYQKDKKSIEVSLFDLETAFAWKEGTLLFSDESLEDIAWRLEMWYDVDVELKLTSPGIYHFTGKFKRQTLEHVLEGMSYTVGFNYTINNKKVIISN